MERYILRSFSVYSYQLAVEENWSSFKQAVIKVIGTCIPCKIMIPYKHIPWLNHAIKSIMQEQKLKEVI